MSLRDCQVYPAVFEQHGIWVQDHPAYSPDLNPIEHVWKAMKSILHGNYPDLHLLSDSEANIAIVDAALKDAWNRDPQKLVDELIDSMPKRMEAVCRARGWYTHY